jgi:hypothetical protein
MLLRLGDQRTDAYLYTDTTERQARKFTLHYRIGEQPEETLEDTNYPYEFSIPMPDAITPLQCRLVAEDLAGKCNEVNLPTLRSSP